MRLFAAIEISSEVKKVIASIQQRLKSLDTRIRFIKPENTHLTLKFLGDVHEKKVSDLNAALSKAVKHIDSFTINTTEIGVFPNLDFPRIVWLGIYDVSGTLNRLWNNLEKEVSEIGFERDEKGFVPHITIGRIKSLRGKSKLKDMVISFNKDIESYKNYIRGMNLMKSRLYQTGAVYTVLKQFDFNLD